MDEERQRKRGRRKREIDERTERNSNPITVPLIPECLTDTSGTLLEKNKKKWHLIHKN